MPWGRKARSSADGEAELLVKFKGKAAFTACHPINQGRCNRAGYPRIQTRSKEILLRRLNIDI